MKRILHILTASVLMLLACGTLSAQKREDCPNDDWRDRIKAERIAYLTDAMELTSAEAEKFWPIYNKCEAEKNESFQACSRIFKELQDALDAGKSDKEISALLDKYIASQEAGFDLDKKYLEKYRKVIPESKVAKLYIGEERFRRQQFHRLKKGPEKAERR